MVACCMAGRPARESAWHAGAPGTLDTAERRFQDGEDICWILLAQEPLSASSDATRARAFRRSNRNNCSVQKAASNGAQARRQNHRSAASWQKLGGELAIPSPRRVGVGYCFERKNKFSKIVTGPRRNLFLLLDCAIMCGVRLP